MKKAILALVTAATVATPVLAQRDWDWGGGRPGGADVRLAGPGVRLLYPELRASLRGRAFVLRNFDYNRNGFVEPREAQAANVAFARIAGQRRDRFDWDARDSGWRRGPPVEVVNVPRPRWDAGAMRGYGFRQTDRGAMLRMDEQVLFATDSSTLRPGAIDKLRALAEYLRAESGVRVAIEGHTDLRGTDAYNQSLSLRRADAVRAAFDDLGVTRARFSVDGKGESQPIASNTTPEGMRQNRRVEITLLGQRADRFR